MNLRQPLFDNIIVHVDDMNRSRGKYMQITQIKQKT